MSKELNESGLTFKEWMRQVDMILENDIGIDHHCCRDRDYWNGWQESTPDDFVSMEWGNDPEEMMEEELFG